ncbi:MAG: PAS domain S-box protein, partial [Pelovirga sp.]
LDEVKGMDWFETFLTPEIDRTIKPLFQKTVADVHTSGNVNPIIAKDGRTILVEWSNKTLKDKDGGIVGILAIGQDITEQKRVEEALRESQELLNTTQRLSKTGGWEWDTVTQTMYWTEETYRIHGFIPGEIEPGSAEHINKSVACYEPDTRPIIMDAFERCVAHGEPYDLELPFTNIKGSQLWVRTIAHPVVESGKVVRVIGNLADITERKQAEEERESLRKTAEALAEVFLDLGREPQQNMDRIVRAAGEVTECAAALYNRLDDTGCFIEVWSGHQLPPDMPRADTPQGHICYEATIHGQDRTVVIGNLEGTEYERTDPAVGKYGLKAYLGHPIHLRGVAIGALAVVDIRPRSFTPGEIGAIKMLAKALSLEEERYLAEQELRQSEERFRGILQNVDTVAVQGYALDGTVRYWNRAAESFYGYTAEEALGRNLLDLIIPPAMRDEVSAAMQHMAQTGEAIPSSELALIRKDGSLIPVYSSHVLVQVAGKDIELYCIDVDLTERKRTELDLIAQKNAYQSILSASHDGFLAVDTQGLILDVNPAYLAFSGYNRDEVLRLHISELDANENAEEAARHINKAMTQGSDLFESVHQRKDGTVWSAEVSTTYSPLSGGCFFTFLRDITERKRAQWALEQKNQEIEQFAYSVSHDLKSPLVTVRTYASMLRQDLLNKDQQQISEDLNYIDKAANKMQQLLDALLQYSRIGREDTHAQTVSARYLVEDCLNALAGILQKYQVQLSTSELSQQLHGNTLHFERIWQNLIENAVKYRGDQALPHIEIGATQEGPDVVFYIRDNGMGIVPEHSEHIFNLFSQLNPASDGSGLGLALVKKIVTIYQGRIWVESDGKGKGSCFYFTLPGALVKEDTLI